MQNYSSRLNGNFKAQDENFMYYFMVKKKKKSVRVDFLSRRLENKLLFVHVNVKEDCNRQNISRQRTDTVAH